MKAQPLPEEELDRLVEDVVSGKLRMHQLPADLSAVAAAQVRRRALERMSGVALENIGRYSVDAGRAATRHCENFIGVAQIPMGVAGPLVLDGAHVEGKFYVPLATTEGALLASTNRGCSAIRAAGGAIARAEDVGMTRGPVFRTGGIRESERFVVWVKENEPAIREAAEGTSRHLRLLEIRPYAFGTTVFLRFRFASGDAMGMNMATIACDRAVRDLIEPETSVPCVALSGNYCSDKKPSAINFHEGRGKRIHCEVRLDAKVLRDCLKTDAAALGEVQYRKILLGSIAAGSSGFNAHYANLVAAFFIATGQDVAHVAESAVGITCVEPDGEGGVLASVYLPDVPLGTVGGGTPLGTQQEALDLLGARPDPEHPGRATLRLAEILGGIVLAGEISLLSALGSHDLTRAHERLARGKRS